MNGLLSSIYFSILIIILLGSKGYGASIKLVGWEHENIKPFFAIEGKIESGDYDKFKDLVFESGVLPYKVYLASKGGNVVDAIKIGHLIRDLNLKTEVPSGVNASTAVCPDYIISDQNNCTCMSACFLIYTAGINRKGNILGLHRAYLDIESLKKLRSEDAFETSKEINNIVSEYLKIMSVPNLIIEKTLSSASDEITWLNDDEIEKNLSGYLPESKDWFIAKCGSNKKLMEEFDELTFRKNGKFTKKETEEKSNILISKMNTIVDCESDLLYKMRQKGFSRFFDKENYCSEYNVDIDFLGLIGKTQGDVERILNCYGFTPFPKKNYSEFEDIRVIYSEYDLDFMSYGILLKYKKSDGYKKLEKIKLELKNNFGHNYTGLIYKNLNDDNLTPKSLIESIGMPDYQRDVIGIPRFMAEELILYETDKINNRFVGFVGKEGYISDEFYVDSVYYMSGEEFKLLDGKIDKTLSKVIKESTLPNGKPDSSKWKEVE